MGPRALAWIRAHPWPAAVAAALVLGLVIGRASRPAPTITAKQTEQVHQQATEHHEAQVATQAQQTTAASSTENLDEQLHAHVHQVERITPRGSKVITTDTTFDDSIHVEEAQQIAVTVVFSQLAQVAGSSTTTTDTKHESMVTQTPAQASDRPLRIDLLAGFSTSGPVYGAGLAWKPGEIPLLHWPVWIGAQAQLGANPTGLLTLGLQP